MLISVSMPGGYQAYERLYDLPRLFAYFLRDLHANGVSPCDVAMKYGEYAWDSSSGSSLTLNCPEEWYVQGICQAFVELVIKSLPDPAEAQKRVLLAVNNAFPKRPPFLIYAVQQKSLALNEHTLAAFDVLADAIAKSADLRLISQGLSKHFASELGEDFCTQELEDLVFFLMRAKDTSLRQRSDLWLDANIVFTLEVKELFANATGPKNAS